MSQAIYIPQTKIQETLKVPPSLGTKLLEPFKTIALTHKLPFKILEDHKVSNTPESHLQEGDLWYCLEGVVTFKYGGNLVNSKFRQNPDGSYDPNELFSDDISSSIEQILKPGDWLWIPAGVPHQHRASETARLMIIKILLSL